MTNKFIRIADLLHKKHLVDIGQLTNKDEQLKAQLAQVEVLNQHSQKIVSFGAEQEVAAIDFKQAMFYRENLNTLLVTQRREISSQRKQIKQQQLAVEQQLQKNSVLKKFGEKQLSKQLLELEQFEEEEIRSSLLLRHNLPSLGNQST